MTQSSHILPSVLSRRGGRLLCAGVLAIAVLIGGFTIPLPAAEERDETEFAIAVLPDTQFYSAEMNGGSRDTFIAQTTWIKKHWRTENIKYVIHLGDVVNFGERRPQEWENAARAMRILEEPEPGLPHGVPYGVTVGNHDQDPGGHALSGSTEYFNRYFGVDHFKGKPWYGGHYGSNNDSHYDLFSAGGLDFIVIYAEYDMFDEDQENRNEWISSVLRQHQDRKAIIVSHSIIQTNQTIGTNEKGFAAFGKQGERLYHKVKYCPNVFLMLSGHVGGKSGEGYRQDVYAGSAIKSMLSDYQGRRNGGDGLMRLMKISPGNDRITVTTFSASTGEKESDGDSSFVRPLFVNTNASRLFDFNNDGRSEIMWFNDGDWKANEGQAVRFGRKGDIPAPADYNGDGQTDLAVFRPAEGRFYIQGKEPVAIGQEGDIPAPGDYDGDGYAEAAVYRPSNGTFYIHGLPQVTFGRRGGIPVPGDYDGDGRTDAAVFSPAAKVWQMHMIGNEVFSELADVTSPYDILPVPADYNGDGRTDMVIFRPSTGEWIFHGRERKVVKLGQKGDLPAPGRYGNSAAAVPAVYRNGRLIFQDREIACDSAGEGYEIVNLPYAIRKAMSQ